MTFLETMYDKFIFRVSTECVYTNDDVWARIGDGVATIGLADLLQKSKGDITLLEMKPVGIAVRQGQEVGLVETIKATFDIISPVTGEVVEVNPRLEAEPFLINEEPYGSGWLYRIRLTDPDSDKAALLSAEDYFEVMKKKVIQEGDALYG